MFLTRLLLFKDFRNIDKYFATSYKKSNDHEMNGFATKFSVKHKWYGINHTITTITFKEIVKNKFVFF